MWIVLQLLAGVALIVGLLAIHAVALYGIWWLVMIVVSYVPMIGHRHRHRDWDRLNRRQYSNVHPEKEPPCE